MRKRRVVGRIYGMKYSWKGHKDRNRDKNRIKRVGKLGWFMSKTQTVTSPPRESEPAGTALGEFETSLLTRRTKTGQLMPKLEWLCCTVPGWGACGDGVWGSWGGRETWKNQSHQNTITNITRKPYLFFKTCKKGCYKLGGTERERVGGRRIRSLPCTVLTMVSSFAGIFTAAFSP